uniref:Uncharacterized protein n=1 Tax=Brassica oleracea var. oleracea TaxID=109376 RepID=A0A0D3A0D1_BRAOL
MTSSLMTMSTSSLLNIVGGNSGSIKNGDHTTCPKMVQRTKGRNVRTRGRNKRRWWSTMKRLGLLVLRLAKQPNGGSTGMKQLLIK